MSGKSKEKIVQELNYIHDTCEGYTLNLIEFSNGVAWYSARCGTSYRLALSVGGTWESVKGIVLHPSGNTLEVSHLEYLIQNDMIECIVLEEFNDEDNDWISEVDIQRVDLNQYNWDDLKLG